MNKLFALNNTLSRGKVVEDKDVCAICLGPANPQGGEFLCSPGCCGKWFHQTCIKEMRKNGTNFCPACRKDFPISPVSNSPVSSPRVSRRSVPSSPISPNPLRPVSAITPASLEEDEIIVRACSSSTHDKKARNPVSEELQIHITPEYPEEGLDANHSFHARISLTFAPSEISEQQRHGLDVVCVLDNSGSMQGGKLANVKRAMEFVIRTFSEHDRLSIVMFNSLATPLQGLWSMTGARQETSKNLIGQITAGGGTNIYDGMLRGWNLLQNRKQRNAAACMFLLTDGQDGSFLQQKKELAKKMREQGTSLFVFGFGNDHDSAHLLEIANAGEGSFVYIETVDTVIDAFGGAIGSQQGQLLRNIQVELQMAGTNVTIDSIHSGSYSHEIEPTWHRSGAVKFADLYGGEKRDFLVKLKLPAVLSPLNPYELFSVRAQYQHYGEEDMVCMTTPKSVSIARVVAVAAARQPHPEIEEQLQRIEVTTAIQLAMAEADQGNYYHGSESIDRARKRIESSPSFHTGSPVVTGFINDLETCRRRVSSMDEYVHSGGKAMMFETSGSYSRQRVIYAKTDSMEYLQSPSASHVQRRARSYRDTSIDLPNTPINNININIDTNGGQSPRHRSITAPTIVMISPRHVDAIPKDTLSDLLESEEKSK